MTSEGNSALLTDGRRYSKLRFSECFQLQNFQLYNKSLKVWSLGPGDNQSLIKCLVFHESQYFDRLSVFKCLSAIYNCFYHEYEEDEVT